MDIFTTALTKVVPVTIKPESLKVKALFKEQGTKELNDDENKLEHHERYHSSAKNKEEKSSSKNNKEHPEEKDFEEGIKASEDVITNRDEIIHPKDHQDKDEEDSPHLDIFV
ncbi:hypothetical protein [Thalassotalea piscium]|uniref:Uncharacterized protein n=1 Tax=Thalassotalea piscium TaxID=1230533 RepID=A0A7X0NHX1_9GAMM|nr:hypothetical protein [Thalassotalea piscium]MBB6543665.1 hypothetical protein [Thalassotalea piscium]